MIPDPVLVVLIALGCAVPVGLLGWVALRLLGHRSIVASVSAAVLTGVLAVVAAVVGTSSAMFLSPHDLGVILTVVVTAGTVALVSGNGRPRPGSGRWRRAGASWSPGSRTISAARWPGCAPSPRRSRTAW